MFQAAAFIDAHPFPRPTFFWLGSYRMRVLRVRDRIVPWQMRHFYYHHETSAKLGVQFSLAVASGHMLHTFADLLRPSLLSPPELIQSTLLLIPGLKALARRISVPRGTLLYQTAQPAQEIMLMVEGYGRLSIELNKGRRLTIGLIAPGDLFGEEALLDIPERESAFEAVVNSSIDAIPKAEFMRMMNENPILTQAVIHHLAQRLLTQQQQMVQMASEPIEQRLARTLLQLAAVKNSPADSSSEPGIYIYHKDLAALLGVWRETITALLNRWAKEGLITQHPGLILLTDISRLQHMAEKINR